jgi:polyhydroxyalkanoate synthesis repressor PhaR
MPGQKGAFGAALAPASRRGYFYPIPQCGRPARKYPMSDQSNAESPPITIKKYANRRLYNTATSSYVTLDHLCQMVRTGQDFVVYDAKTGQDITRSVLTQIIVEEEAKGQNLLPISFLRQLIGMYGNSMQWMVPRYLECSMQSFAENQDRMRDYFTQSFGSMFPFNTMEEVGKQNMAMFEQAMRLFSPFGNVEPGKAGAPGEDNTGGGQQSAANQKGLDELRQKLDDLQRQIAEIAPTQKG